MKKISTKVINANTPKSRNSPTSAFITFALAASIDALLPPALIHCIDPKIRVYIKRSPPITSPRLIINRVRVMTKLTEFRLLTLLVTKGLLTKAIKVFSILRTAASSNR